MAHREERRTELQERREERIERSRDRRDRARGRDPHTDEREGAIEDRDDARRTEPEREATTDTGEASAADEATTERTTAGSAKEPSNPRATGRAQNPNGIALELAHQEPADADAKRASVASAIARPEAPKAPADLPLVRALAAAHADANPAQLDPPVSATGESSDVVPTTLRAEDRTAHSAVGPDEARGRAASEPTTSETQAQPAQRFDVAARADELRATAAPRSDATPTPADARAADILRQLRLELAVGRREAHLHLEPAELGRISVKLALDRGRLRAEVRAESSDTLAVLQRHVPELRAMLEARGVAPESFDFQLGFQDGRRNGAQDGEGRHGARNGASEPANLLVRAAREVRSLVRGVWGIDTYA